MNNIPKKLGRYQVIRELGRGAMGVVYKAADPVIERDVAIKAIHLAFQVTNDEKQVYLNRFYREAKAAGKLNHPNIVTIYDVDEDKESGAPFIVMEFLEGTTLQEIISDGILLPLEDVNSIIVQIAGALHYAHKQGVIHRDVKAANILVLEGMKAKIMDFGIARISSSDLTKSGQFIGTPNYMSPEQIDGRSMVDGRSDLFALGVILYLLLTGERPFSGDSFTSISYKIVHVDPIPPRTVNPAVPEVYNRILDRLLAKDPAIRYQNGEDLIEDIKRLNDAPQATADQPVEQIQQEEVTIVTPEQQAKDELARLGQNTESMPKSSAAQAVPSKSMPIVAITAAAFVLFAVVAGAGFYFWKSPKDQTPPQVVPASHPAAHAQPTLTAKQIEIRNKWNLAQNYEKNGFFDKSIQLVQEILVLDPENQEAKDYLATLQSKKQPE